VWWALRLSLGSCWSRLLGPPERRWRTCSERVFQGPRLAGRLAFLIGLILFGAATMRAGVFPRWAGLLLIVGDAVFGLGSFAGSAATIFEIVGALITCVALLWLGLSLLSGGATSQGNPLV
jgi:hypothetical protein